MPQPTMIEITLPKVRFKDQESSLFFSAKNRARRKNLPFNISKKDIFIPPYCPVLGIPLLREGPLSDFSPSLDRIIPEYGYVRGNIVVMSAKANRIKNDATVEELKKVYDFVKKVTDNKKLLDKYIFMHITGKPIQTDI